MVVARGRALLYRRHGNALPPGDGPPGRPDPTESDPVPAIERRLVEARDPREIALWTQVRGEILRQNQDVLDRQAARQQRIEGARAEIGKGFLAVAVGVLLVQQEYWIPGFLCLGAGFYSLAPDYVRQFNPWRRREGGDDDQD